VVGVFFASSLFPGSPRGPHFTLKNVKNYKKKMNGEKGTVKKQRSEEGEDSVKQ